MGGYESLQSMTFYGLKWFLIDLTSWNENLLLRRSEQNGSALSSIFLWSMVPVVARLVWSRQQSAPLNALCDTSHTSRHNWNTTNVSMDVRGKMPPTSLTVSSGLSSETMAWRCLWRVSGGGPPSGLGEGLRSGERPSLDPSLSPSSSRRTTPLTHAKLSL